MTSAPSDAAQAEQLRIATKFRPVNSRGDSVIGPPTGGTARRRTQRLLMPTLRFLIEGQPLVSVDWSLGGLQVEPYAGTLRSGADFSIAAIGSAEGPLMPVGIRARVMRCDGDSLAAMFVELDVRAFDTLEAMMLQRRQYLASLAATARAVA